MIHSVYIQSFQQSARQRGQLPLQHVAAMPMHASLPAQKKKKSHEETEENDEGRGQKLGTGASETIEGRERGSERDLHARERLVGKTLPSAARLDIVMPCRSTVEFSSLRNTSPRTYRERARERESERESERASERERTGAKNILMLVGRMV
jgi:hypothetical protein